MKCFHFTTETTGTIDESTIWLRFPCLGTIVEKNAVSTGQIPCVSRAALTLWLSAGGWAESGRDVALFLAAAAVGPGFILGTSWYA